MRRFTRFRRFSATPRRSWFKRRPVSVAPSRMQQAQVCLPFDFVVPTPSGGEVNYLQQPTFNVLALTPWENLSESGYDRSIDIKGLIWNLDVKMQSYDDAGTEIPGPVPNVRAFAPLATSFFVDAQDPETGAPLSYLDPPYGPFYSSTPVAAPGNFEVTDSQFPVRTIKRTQFRLKVGEVQETGTAYGAWADAGGYTSFRWSGTLRRRITVSDRQALYWGICALNPFNSAGNDVTFSVWFSANYWYTLRR